MQEEKEVVQNIFSKESIHSFEEQMNTVPENYFETFPEKILATIEQKKKPGLIIRLNKFSIAAAFLIIIAGTYFFVSQENVQLKNSIAIQEIPSSEIDTYVSNNEWLADAEMQAEINNVGLNLDIDNTSKDSID
jgi:hypothetical protein